MTFKFHSGSEWEIWKEVDQSLIWDVADIIVMKSAESRTWKTVELLSDHLLKIMTYFHNEFDLVSTALLIADRIELRNNKVVFYFSLFFRGRNLF